MSAGGARLISAESSATLAIYRRLLRYARPYAGFFFISVIAAAAFSATAAGFAALMKPLVDEGFVNRTPQMIESIPLILIGLFLLRGVASFFQEYTLRWVGRRVTYDVRNDIFRHMTRLPASYYDVTPSASLVSRLIFDLEQISSAITQAVLAVIADGLTVIALVAYLLYLDWQSTLIFGFVMPAAILLLRLMSRRFRRTSGEIQRTTGEIAQVAQEAATGHKVVKAYGAEAFERENFDRANERNRRQFMRKATVATVGQPIIQFLAACAVAAVIFFALKDGRATAGTFVSYMVALLWLMNPIKRLTKINEVVQTGLAAASSAFAVLDVPPEPDDGKIELKDVKGRIVFRSVSFRYSQAAVPALREVSLTLEPGRTLALVGASGSGKTTIANLVMRFYRAGEGEIVLDGVDINDATLASLRRNIAYVGQEALLFNDTIARNIAYGAEGAIDPTRLQEAMRAAHVLEFVERLPQGVDTPVGEKGARLSGGQRQRVAIARALYKNAPILVLDEATSALDAESERLVQEAMEKLMAGRTTLVIAHRLSTVERADRIVVLSHGRIVESGTHRELLARNGEYAALYRNQFDTAPA